MNDDNNSGFVIKKCLRFEDFFLLLIENIPQI